jgi:hypothetical protein
MRTDLKQTNDHGAENIWNSLYLTSFALKLRFVKVFPTMPRTLCSQPWVGLRCL